MSADATGWTWKHSPFSGAQLLVHLAVADVANDLHDNEFWMSTETLSRKARVSRSTVTTTLREMVAKGLAEVLSAGGSSRKPTRYRFLMPTSAVSALDTRGGRASTSAVSARYPNYNPKEPNPPALSLLGSDPLEDEFSRWWEKYPARKGSKAKARECYIARRRAGVATADLLRAVGHYAAEREGEDAQFTMHASTFLSEKGERWTEYLSEREPEDDMSEGEREIARMWNA